jgi:hypothetical protein
MLRVWTWVGFDTVDGRLEVFGVEDAIRHVGRASARRFLLSARSNVMRGEGWNKVMIWSIQLCSS